MGRDDFDDPAVLEFEDDFGDEDTEKKQKKKKGGGFQAMGLDPPVYKAIVKKGFRVPTPIQRKTIPLVMQGADVVAMARTGSGKTASFVIPMVQKLRSHSTKVGVRAVLLSPTRDLALQTATVVKEFIRFTDLRYCALVGGSAMDRQFEDLASNPDIIVATPGRLVHLLVETELSLASVQYLVFDEADRLFEMGFAEQLQQILKRVASERQTLLFSATMPKVLVEFARAGLREPQVVRLDTETKISDALQIAFFTVRHEEKLGALLYILRELVAPGQQSIIFACTRHHVEFLHTALTALGIRSTFCYGSMDAEARVTQLTAFRKHRCDVLIVTDVAARGLDIPLLDNVINYDFPASPKLFVHRVGRVARAGRTGVAYSLVAPDEVPYMIDLHLFLPRPLQNTWTTEGDAPPPPGEVFYGNIPQSELDVMVEQCRAVVEQSADCQALLRSMDGATKLYVRTRAPASKTSVRRAKSLDLSKIHPALLARSGRDVQRAQDILQQLKKFRPMQTALEIEAQRQHNVAAGAAMSAKRALHRETIERRRMLALLKSRGADAESGEDVSSGFRTASDSADGADSGSDAGRWDSSEAEPTGAAAAAAAAAATASAAAVGDKRKKGSGVGGRPKRPKPASFRDEEFFIPYQPRDDATERGLAVNDRDLVFDVGADDAEGLQKKKAVMKWDMKTKRYALMETSKDGKVLKKVRNESGQKIDAPYKTGRYERWKKTTHKHIPEVGEVEGDTSAAPEHGPLSRRERPNKHVRDELVRSAAELRNRKQSQQRKKGRPKKSREAEQARKAREAAASALSRKARKRALALGLSANSVGIAKRRSGGGAAGASRTKIANKQRGKKGGGGGGGKGR